MWPPRKILVTGFGPFPGAPDNPSEQLVQAIASGSLRLPRGTAVSTAILPTSWDRVAAMAPALIARHRPDAAIHFGLSAEARGFRIEQIARNSRQLRPDVDDRLPHGPRVRRSGLPMLRSRLPAAQLVTALRARGLRAELSHDAGGYLCNQLFYLSLAQGIGRRQAIDAMFVHVPLPSAFADARELHAGTETILRLCAAHIARNPRNRRNRPVKRHG